MKIKNINFRKKFISSLTLISLLFMNSKDPIIEPYTNYSKGYIYILDNVDQIDNINQKENDVYIIDQRNNKDPNIKIVNSYLINDKETMNEIIDILLEYEYIYPSNWNRNKNSLLNEWLVHNNLFYINYEVVRTKDVDFNNKDERRYNLFKIR